MKQNSKRYEATEGEIIVYNDELITAMFFSTSNGLDRNVRKTIVEM